MELFLATKLSKRQQYFKKIVLNVMDKKNKISKILNYCPELLQQRIQGTQMALRLKQRHTLVTAGGRHLLQEAFMTGVQDMDRMNNPEYLHRRNDQNSICIQNQMQNPLLLDTQADAPLCVTAVQLLTAV